MTEKLQGREVIFEFMQVGNIMRVSAMDTASLTEIIIQCPAGAGQAAFKKNALLRLEYVLRKKGLIK
ncbi:MAG: hypothetical protein Q8K65_03870 [Alphaproteobacteria bacterium]|nr:hypothetical protein [Alphaproteobacteria bacterium]